MDEELKRYYETQKKLTSFERIQYQQDQRKKILDDLLWNYIKSGNLYLFLAGSGSSRVPDIDDMGFTNAGVVLNSLYRIYLSHPELNIDDEFEKALIALFDGPVGYVYSAFNTVYTQLINEKNGVSPFQIDNSQVYIAMKESIIKNIDILKSDNSYRGKLYENNYYGFVEDIDKQLVEQKGIKIL